MPSSDLQKSLFWSFLPLNCYFSSLMKLCLPYSNLDGDQTTDSQGAESTLGWVSGYQTGEVSVLYHQCP